MNSMTGFGKAEVKSKAGRFVVEISSVNNRFLEISPRLPRAFFVLEAGVRELINSKISRGKINVYVNYEEPAASKSAVINEAYLKRAYRQLSAIKKELKSTSEISLSELLILPEISKTVQNNIDEKVIWASLKRAILKALNDLLKMRKDEGNNIAVDIKKRSEMLLAEIKKIEKKSKASVKEYRDRINKRITELIDSNKVNKTRLEEEVALIAERTDITEECIRFVSHLKQLKSALNLNQPVGKKLNFILQELNREANTVASKCSNIDISQNVISIKEEIEKMREQVQNLE